MPDLPIVEWDPGEQLMMAVREETFLWELPLGTDCGMHGAMVFHPPPDTGWASQQLQTWFHAGLIQLQDDVRPADWHRLSGRERRRLEPIWRPVVPVGRTRQVLADPARWTFEQPDGLLALRLTGLGLTADEAAFAVTPPGTPQVS